MAAGSGESTIGGSRMKSSAVDIDLLCSEVATMPGGRDNYGRPLIVFPAATQDKLLSRFTAAHVVLLLRFYVNLAHSSVLKVGFAVLVNMKTYTKEVTQMLLDALEKVQVEARGSIAVLYAVPPKHKDVHKQLRKLVGLKVSKKHPKTPTFETILLEEPQTLYRYVDRRQLPAEFGGTMAFKHDVWVTFIRRVEELEDNVNVTLQKVPAGCDKLQMALEYDIPTNPEDIQTLLLQIRNKYHDIMRDLNVEHLIDSIKSLEAKLASPEEHPPFSDIANTLTFHQAKVKLDQQRHSLIVGREELKSLWQQAEGRITVATRISKYRVKADKVLEWIHDVGVPTVNQDPEIADCLSKAEILKNHFETGFYSVAQNVRWMAEKIQKKFDSTLLDSKSDPSLEGVLQYSRQFQATLEYFRQAVEKKRQVYLNVHNFFLTSSKNPGVITETSRSIQKYLEQVAQWYQRTLLFLPVHLLRPGGTPRQGHSKPGLNVSPAWRAAIDNYLLHHPAPKAQHLQRVKNIIPVLDNIQTRNQARLLVARTSLLISFLTAPDALHPNRVKDVLHWKNRTTQGREDVHFRIPKDTQAHTLRPGRASIHFPAELEDPLKTRKPEPPQPNLQHSTSVHTLNRTPKLKTVGLPDNTFMDQGAANYYSLPRMDSKKQGAMQIQHSLRQPETELHGKRKVRPKSANPAVFFSEGSSAGSDQSRNVTPLLGVAMDTSRMRISDAPEFDAFDFVGVSSYEQDSSYGTMHSGILSQDSEPDSVGVLASSSTQTEIQSSDISTQLDSPAVPGDSRRDSLPARVPPLATSSDTETPHDHPVSVSAGSSVISPQVPSLTHADIPRSVAGSTIPRTCQQPVLTGQSGTHSAAVPNSLQLSQTPLYIPQSVVASVSQDIPHTVTMVTTGNNFPSTQQLSSTHQHIPNTVMAGTTIPSPTTLINSQQPVLDSQGIPYSAPSGAILPSTPQPLSTNQSIPYSSASGAIFPSSQQQQLTNQGIPYSTPGGTILPSTHQPLSTNQGIPYSSASGAIFPSSQQQQLTNQGIPYSTSGGAILPSTHHPLPHTQSTHYSTAGGAVFTNSQQPILTNQEIPHSSGVSSLINPHQPSLTHGVIPQSIATTGPFPSAQQPVLVPRNIPHPAAVSINSLLPVSTNQHIPVTETMRNLLPGTQQPMAVRTHSSAAVPSYNAVLPSSAARQSYSTGYAGHMPIPGQQDNHQPDLNATTYPAQVMAEPPKTSRYPELGSTHNRGTGSGMEMAPQHHHYEPVEMPREARRPKSARLTTSSKLSWNNQVHPELGPEHYPAENYVHLDEGRSRRPLSAQLSLSSEYYQPDKMHSSGTSPPPRYGLPRSGPGRDVRYESHPASVGRSVSHPAHIPGNRPRAHVDRTLSHPASRGVHDSALSYKHRPRHPDYAHPPPREHDRERHHSRERYVSLDYGRPINRESTSRLLPQSLRHIDIAAMESNIPQHHYHRPRDKHHVTRHSYDCLLDSGIEPYGLGAETSELSPRFNANKTKPTPKPTPKPRSSIKPKTSATLKRTLSNAKSLPNLVSLGDGEFSLTQDNVDLIVNSELTPEEKMDVMAAMCECNDIEGYKLPAELRKKLLQAPTSRKPPAQSEAPNRETTDSDHTKQSDRSAEARAGPRSSSETAVGMEEPAVKPPPGSSASPPTDQALDEEVAVYNATPSHQMSPEGDSHPTLPLGLAKEEPHYGIDIEEWMRKHELGMEEPENADTSMFEGTDGMEEYMEKLASAKEGRKSTELELVAAQDDLEDLVLAEEEAAQDEVERALRRTDRMLQEQEALLEEERQAASLEFADLGLSGLTGPRDVWEGSASEESGFYTQGSQDSRLKGSETASDSTSSRNSQGKGLSRRGSSPEQYKSAAASKRQMHFRDRLRQLSLDVLDKELDELGSLSSSEVSTLTASSSTRTDTDAPSVRNRFPWRAKSPNSIIPKKSNSQSLPLTVKDTRGRLNRDKSSSLDDDIAAFMKGSDNIKDHINVKGPKQDMTLSSRAAEKPPSSRSTAPRNISTSGKLKSATATSYPHPSQLESVSAGKNPSYMCCYGDGQVLDCDDCGVGSHAICTCSEDCPCCHGNGKLANCCPGDLGGGCERCLYKNRAHFVETNEVCGEQNKVGISEVQTVGHSRLRDDSHCRGHCKVMHEGLNKARDGGHAEVIDVSCGGGQTLQQGGATVTQMEGPPGGGGGGEGSLKLPCDLASAPVLRSYNTELLNLQTPVIIDNGSGFCKCGLASQQRPAAIFPAYVGRPKYEDVTLGRFTDTYVGEAAQNMRGVLKLHYPLEHGIVTSWDDMELIWSHALYDQLRVNPEDHPVLVTEAPMNPRKNRELMAEVMFETFQVPALYVALQAVLALYATGRTTGVVLDSGDGVSHVVPVYEGYSLPHALRRLDLAGRDLTQYLVKLLQENGHTMKTTAEHDIVRDMKEKLCYVSQDIDLDMQRSQESSDLEEAYILPDGHVITLSSERFRCPEALFNPSLLGREHHGIHEAVLDSVTKCDLDLRRDLLNNVLLSGGSTLFPGLSSRLEQELRTVAAPGLCGSVQVTCPAERQLLVWQGGAVLAGLPTFVSAWISRQQYYEEGSSIIHRMCF